MFNPVPGKPDEPDKPNEPEDSAAEPPLQQPLSFTPDPGIDEEAYTYALECLLKGNTPAQVRRRLIDAGHSKLQANQIIQAAVNFRQQYEANQRGSAARFGGGTLIIFGLGMWIASWLYRMAGGPSDACISLGMAGTDIIGLILVIMGFVRVVRGRASNRS